MTLALKKMDWLKLYKALQKAGREFPQYSYKNFARRRIRDYFEFYRKQQLDSGRWEELYKEGQSTLVTIQRQASISRLYPHRPLVIEQQQKQKRMDEQP